MNEPTFKKVFGSQSDIYALFKPGSGISLKDYLDQCGGLLSEWQCRIMIIHIIFRLLFAHLHSYSYELKMENIIVEGEDGRVFSLAEDDESIFNGEPEFYESDISLLTQIITVCLGEKSSTTCGGGGGGENPELTESCRDFLHQIKQPNISHHAFLLHLWMFQGETPFDNWIVIIDLIKKFIRPSSHYSVSLEKFMEINIYPYTIPPFQSSLQPSLPIDLSECYEASNIELNGNALTKFSEFVLGQHPIANEISILKQFVDRYRDDWNILIRCEIDSFFEEIIETSPNETLKTFCRNANEQLPAELQREKDEYECSTRNLRSSPPPPPPGLLLNLTKFDCSFF